MTDIEKIKKLRKETSLSISECKRALEMAKGDLRKAKEFLSQWARDFAKEKSKKEAKEGIIESYIHPNKKIGVLLELRCQTDFVANSKEFRDLAHQICLQIAAMGGKDLLEQAWIKDEKKKIKDLIAEFIAKFGENIKIERFTRYEL